jgi:hypothetical protein
MGVNTFISLLEGATLICSSTIGFGYILGTPNWKCFFGPGPHKTEANILHCSLPFQFIYIRVELWGAIWNKLRCYLELLGNNLGTWIIPWGTHWEQGKKQSTSGPKEKNSTPHEVHAEPSHWLHETFISNTVCPRFRPG